MTLDNEYPRCPWCRQPCPVCTPKAAPDWVLMTLLADTPAECLVCHQRGLIGALRDGHICLMQHPELSLRKARKKESDRDTEPCNSHTNGCNAYGICIATRPMAGCGSPVFQDRRLQRGVWLSVGRRDAAAAPQLTGVRAGRRRLVRAGHHGGRFGVSQPSPVPNHHHRGRVVGYADLACRGVCCVHQQTSPCEYWTFEANLPRVAHLVALDRLIDPEAARAPHPHLLAQLRRIIRHAIGQHADGYHPDSRLFHELYTLIPRRMLCAIPRINQTVGMAITAPGVVVSADFVDFVLKAVEYGALSLDKWDTVTVAVAFHRIASLFPEKHAACIHLGASVPTNRTEVRPFRTVYSTAVELWRVHHAPGACNLLRLDETIANLVTYSDAYNDDEEAAGYRAAYREQLLANHTVLNHLLVATATLFGSHKHIVSMSVEPVTGPVPIPNQRGMEWNRAARQPIICPTARSYSSFRWCPCPYRPRGWMRSGLCRWSPPRTDRARSNRRTIGSSGTARP